MYEIPLFPLNTVLFPGMPMQLHIFEERYKILVRQCLEYEQPFGVVLIRHGKEASGPLPAPYPVGCTARIIKMKPLQGGRINILTIGVERFRTMTLDAKKQPYLTGIVEKLTFTDEGSVDHYPASQDLRAWLRRYLKMMNENEQAEIAPLELPDDPIALAFLGAVALQIPPREKQALLDQEHARILLDDLVQIFRREVAIGQRLSAENQPGSIGSFSVN